MSCGSIPTNGRAAANTPASAAGDMASQEGVQLHMSDYHRILTIDGGGLKGTVPAAFLAYIEERIDKPLHEYFDVIVGTSTGGIIAAGLALGMSASKILAIYENDGPRIFPTTTRFSRMLLWWKGLVRAKYPVRVLRKVLTEHFPTQVIGDARTRLVIPSWDPEVQRVYVWKTRHDERFLVDHKKSVVEALVATASAPTYFASSFKSGGTGLIDGGVWANNPMLVATVEALAVLKWNPASIHMLSLGCIKEDLKAPDDGGRIRWAKSAFDLFLQAQSRSALASTCLLLDDKGHPPERLYRIEPSAEKGQYELDSADQIGAMRKLGEELAKKHLKTLRPKFFVQPVEAFKPIPMPVVAAGRSRLAKLW